MAEAPTFTLFLALNQDVTQQVVRTLSGVLEQDDRHQDIDSPLLAAAGAVGKSLGIAIEPPAPSENASRTKEPLEEIARASQLRLRRVLLRGQWWQQDSGPLVAYTREDRHPVAVLPSSGSRYELFDPVALKEGTATARAPVSQEIANTLDPVAFIFYRPLPTGDLNALSLLKFTFRGQGRDWLAILLTGIAATLIGMLVP